ncbi:MAG: ATP-binding protein [Acidobacteriota bacterium]
MTEASGEKLALLMEIVRVVGSARDVRGVLVEVCTRVARLCDAERGTVFLYDAEADEVTPAMSQLASSEPRTQTWQRFKQLGKRPVAEMNLIRQLTRHREPITVDDARDSPLVGHGWVDSFGCRSILAVPLLIEDRAIGALVLDTITQVRPFDRKRVELAVAAAEQVAIVLQRALMLEETELRLERSEARLRIARTLDSALELKLVLKEIAQQASLACGMDRCSIYLFEGEQLTPVMSQFGDGRADADLWASFKALRLIKVGGLPFLAVAMKTQAPVIIQDPPSDPLVPAKMDRFNLRQILAVPLIRRQEVMGAIAFDNAGRESRPVQSAQVDMATTIASQVALVIENARLHEETQERLRQAQAASRAKSAFLANMSHELRTPLNGVIGMAELLLYSELTDDQREQTEIINSSAEILLRVVDDILDFSKIEAGKLSIEAADFDLKAVADGLLDLFAIRAAEQGIGFTIEIATGLPTHLHGDATRLRQVLINLVGNAIKFTQEGSVDVRITAGEDNGHGSALAFTVRDTGIGIAPEAQGKLFEPFTQADATTTRRFGGTGLGLAISRRIVELMGGEISLESSLGVGSTFRLVLPFEPAEEQAPRLDS